RHGAGDTTAASSWARRSRDTAAGDWRAGSYTRPSRRLARAACAPPRFRRPNSAIPSASGWATGRTSPSRCGSNGDEASRRYVPAVRRAYSDEELDAAIDALTSRERFREAESVVTAAAPKLQRVLVEALESGGWF